jgi:hypothetical protein
MYFGSLSEISVISENAVLEDYRHTVEKNWEFLTSFSLSNKSTYSAYIISYRKISEINVKAKFCGFHFHGKFCSEKP